MGDMQPAQLSIVQSSDNVKSSSVSNKRFLRGDTFGSLRFTDGETPSAPYRIFLEPTDAVTPKVGSISFVPIAQRRKANLRFSRVSWTLEVRRNIKPGDELFLNWKVDLKRLLPIGEWGRKDFAAYIVVDMEHHKLPAEGLRSLVEHDEDSGGVPVGEVVTLYEELRALEKDKTRREFLERVRERAEIAKERKSSEDGEAKDV